MKRKVEKIIEDTEVGQGAAESCWMRSAAGVFFIVAAVAVVAVYLAGDLVPALIPGKTALKLALGSCWPVLVILLAIVGTNILSNREYGFFSFKNIFLFLLFLTIPALVHHFNVPVGKELFPDILREARGGGFVGGLFVLFLHRVSDGNTTLFVLLAILTVSFVCLLPYKDIFSAVIWPFVELKRVIFGRNSSDRDDEDGEKYDEDEDEDDDEEYDEEYDDDYDEDEAEKESVIKKEVPSFVVKTEPVIYTAEEKGSENFLSARSIIASRRKRQQEKKEEPSVIEQIYGRKEFRGFSDGVRKENILKRIMSRRSEDNVYNQPGIRENLKENPVDIPTWQGEAEQEDSVDFVSVDNSNETEEIAYAEQNNSVKETDTISKEERKVIPLFGEKPVGNVESASEEEGPVIRHYRENEDDDTDASENDKVNLASVTAKPKLGRIRYKYPKLDLLDKPKHLSSSVYEKDIQKQSAVLKQTLEDFGVNARIVGVTRGPSVTRFEIAPAPGVKVSVITSLADDIALNLAAGGVRIEAPIPGKAAIGIEVPNVQNDSVYFREIVDTEEVKGNSSPLCIGLGKDISGNVITVDLTKMPHLLVAGSTGSGKSVCINTLIGGILFKAHPEEVKLILVDPKMVELSNYNGIPHLLTPVVTDMKKAASALQWARKEMERRYQIFAEHHTREISSYNLGAEVKLPYIVVIIDELSDLMMVARIDVEDAILALAQKARAAGIHLVLATQRPSVDVITGVIKANIPSRISFAVSSQIDSRTILDVSGAEKLIGKGDMLFYPVGFNKPMRVQGAFISDGEINRVSDFVVGQHYASDFVEEVTSQDLSADVNRTGANVENRLEDEIFLDVLRLVMDTGQVSASMLQRKFRVGYTRAARLVDKLEEMGIVGQVSGSKPRELLLSREEIENRFFGEDRS